MTKLARVGVCALLCLLASAAPPSASETPGTFKPTQPEGHFFVGGHYDTVGRITLSPLGSSVSEVILPIASIVRAGRRTRSG